MSEPLSGQGCLLFILYACSLAIMPNSFACTLWQFNILNQECVHAVTEQHFSTFTFELMKMSLYLNVSFNYLFCITSSFW